MKIVVISPSIKSLRDISAMLERGDPARVISCHEGGISKLRTLAEQERPDIIIVEGLCLDGAELLPMESVTTKYPKLIVVMLCSQRTPEFLINAMRVGVREVLPSPVPSPALEAAVARAEAKLGVQSERLGARVLAFLSSKGGAGATFLATNLGYQLAGDGRKVLLIDLNLQFGEAALTVHDRTAASDIAEVARNLSRLDASFLSASTVQVSSHYEILAAPDDPAQSLQIKPEHVEAILNVAVKHYDFVILDVSKNLDDVSIKALDRAHQIVLVAQAMLPYVRNAKQLMNVFRSLGYPSDKIELVINRYLKNAEISLDDLRSALGVSGMRTIPNRYAEVAKAVNQGIPLAMVSTSSPVFRGLSEWAESLHPKVEQVQAGLFSRLLNIRKAS